MINCLPRAVSLILNICTVIALDDGLLRTSTGSTFPSASLTM